MLERDKYIAMWGIDKYREYSPGEQYVHEVLEILRPDEGVTVIDFGCGTGRAAHELRMRGYSVLAVDFAHNCLDKDIHLPLLVADLISLPELHADWGLCCDVMEHIPEHQVDDVLSGIARSVGKVFFSIAMHQDSAGQLIGEKLHMTVQSAQWWESSLDKHFSRVECDDRGSNLIAVCWT